MLLRRVSLLLLAVTLSSMSPIPAAPEGIPLPGPEHAYAQTQVCTKHQICVRINALIATFEYCYERTLCEPIDEKPQPTRDRFSGVGTVARA